jgi:hypothetical protein
VLRVTFERYEPGTLSCNYIISLVTDFRAGICRSDLRIAILAPFQRTPHSRTLFEYQQRLKFRYECDVQLSQFFDIDLPRHCSLGLNSSRAKQNSKRNERNKHSTGATARRTGTDATVRRCTSGLTGAPPHFLSPLQPRQRRSKTSP